MPDESSGGDGPADTPRTPAEPSWRTDLRFGGWVGLTDDALLVAQDDRRVRVAYDDVAQVTVQDVDYFQVMLSLVLVGFGGWFALQDPRALVFSAVGVAAGYWTYRHRHEVSVYVRNRSKPVVFHPADVTELQERLRPAIAPEEEKAIGGHR